MAEFRKQTLKPMHRPGGFDPDAHGLLQTPIERLGFSAFVVKASFGQQLARGVLGAILRRTSLAKYSPHAVQLGVINFQVYAGFTTGLDQFGIGLLGQDGFFDKFKITFDYTHGLYSLETP